MSRFKRFASSLLSGYALILANIFYTLASVPLALHYLSKEQFGLWALVMQVCNFNQIMIDLGMSGALARVLIDHKDDQSSTSYGSVIQTGFLILLVQGVLMAVIGGAISYWLPQWMDVPPEYWRDFRLLVIGQCGLLAIGFALRIGTFILHAHQRFDITNYAQLGGFVVGLVALWLGFEAGLGIFSLLVSAVAPTLFVSGVCFWGAYRLKLFPGRGRWGRPDRKTFRELFFYGTDLFLVSIGLQLITASQTLVITRTLGLEATAVWSIASKLFMLSQQLVYRLLDFSLAAFSEMMVRGEKARLQERFRDLVILSGSASAAIGVTGPAAVRALCARQPQAHGRRAGGTRCAGTSRCRTGAAGAGAGRRARVVARRGRGDRPGRAGHRGAAKVHWRGAQDLDAGAEGSFRCHRHHRPRWGCRGDAWAGAR